MPRSSPPRRASSTDALRRIGRLDAARRDRDHALALRLRLPQPHPRARRRPAAWATGGAARTSLCATTRCPVLLPALDEKLHELAQRPPREDGEWELAWGEGEARAVPLAAPGGERVSLEVAGERIGISPGVFAQSNALLLPALAARLLALAGAGGSALELYAGAGCFTLPLARRFEQRRRARRRTRARCATCARTCTSAGIANVEVLAETLERALERDALALLAPEVLVLDPPRAGLPEGAVEALARLAPARVVYLSCDPATLARDLALWVARGWALRSVHGFDLFPQTPHVEALALLERD